MDQVEAAALSRAIRDCGSEGERAGASRGWSPHDPALWRWSPPAPPSPPCGRSRPAGDDQMARVGMPPTLRGTPQSNILWASLKVRAVVVHCRREAYGRARRLIWARGLAFPAYGVPTKYYFVGTPTGRRARGRGGDKCRLAATPDPAPPVRYAFLERARPCWRRLRRRWGRSAAAQRRCCWASPGQARVGGAPG